MRFARLALQYLRKNFWYLALVTLIPSVVMGLLTEPCTMIQFFVEFDQTKLITFKDVFFSISESGFLQFVN